MAAPTTLVEFWTEEVGRLDSALTQTRAVLATAVTAEASAVTAFTQSGKDLRDARDAADAARKKLAGIPMPADGDPLLTDMRTALVAWRNAASAHVATDTDLRRKRAQRQYLNGRVASLSTRLAEAKKTLIAEQEKASVLRQVWIDAALASPLKDLPSVADAALTEFGGDAEAKVKVDFPSSTTPAKDFLTRVRARRKLGSDAVTDAADIASDALAINTDWDEQTTRECAKTPALQRAFDAAVETLRAFFNAPQKVSQASAALEVLANRPSSPLTAAQRAELTNPALKTSREDALVNLKARDDAQAAVFEAQTTYDKELFKAQADDPDKSEADLLASDAALKGKHDAIDTKRDELTNVEGTLAPGLAALQTWFAAVPDVLWDQLDALDAAVADLNAVKAINPVNLVNDLKAKEESLAENLDARSKERRLIELLRDGLSRRQTELADERDLDPRRKQAAARFVAQV